MWYDHPFSQNKTKERAVRGGGWRRQGMGGAGQNLKMGGGGEGKQYWGVFIK